MRTLFAVLALAGMIAMPVHTLRASQDRKDDHSADRAGDRGKAAEYHFQPEHAEKLRQNYKHIEKVDVAHRPEYRAGGRLPDDWRKRMHPVPSAVVRGLPPVPAGYAIGYFDGYCVVYNPTTLLIADVIDLATGH